MEEDTSPTFLNVTGESSSTFKLVVNVDACFVEFDEHNEGIGVRAIFRPGAGGGGVSH